MALFLWEDAMPRYRKIELSDSSVLSIKIGALVSIVTGALALAWFAATEWNNLNNRIERLERTQQWHTDSLKSLRK